MKRVLLVLIVAFVLIQFLQPARNQSGQANPMDVSRIYPTPESVQGILQNSCYDCHSNNTRYPWYSFLQPTAWWMAWHIKKGKSELNFNEFGTYSQRRQKSKLKAVAGSIKEGSMPLSSYTLIHSNAMLSEEDKQLILNWTTKTIDSLSQNR